MGGEEAAGSPFRGFEGDVCNFCVCGLLCGCEELECVGFLVVGGGVGGVLGFLGNTARKCGRWGRARGRFEVERVGVLQVSEGGCSVD